MIDGRWMPTDPIGFDGGSWNPYEYVGNGPVVGVDPSGLDPVYKGACARLWAQLQEDCKDKEDQPIEKSCKSLGNDKCGRDCPEISKRLFHNAHCAYLRIQVYYKCAQWRVVPSGPDMWTTGQVWGHYIQIGTLIGNATLCAIKFGENNCGGGFPIIPDIVPEPVWARPPGVVKSPFPFTPHCDPLPQWVLALLATGGIAAVLAFCVAQPEACIGILPILKQCPLGEPLPSPG